MGCSIHLHTEIKILLRGQLEHSSVWHHYSCPNLKNDYELFTKMAGVRAISDEIEPICKPKGLPSDPTLVTQLDVDFHATDVHNASWFNQKEIITLSRWLEDRLQPDSWKLELKYWGYLFGAGWDCELDNLSKSLSNTSRIVDVRFVFWFTG